MAGGATSSSFGIESMQGARSPNLSQSIRPRVLEEEAQEFLAASQGPNTLENTMGESALPQIIN